MNEMQPSRSALNDFGLETSAEPARLKVRFYGNADIKAIEPIERGLAAVHAQAQKLGVSEVLVDLIDLEFMNSSCFKSFINWLNRIRSLDEQARYRIQFRSNPSAYWQRRSLHALSCFASELITLES